MLAVTILTLWCAATDLGEVYSETTKSHMQGLRWEQLVKMSSVAQSVMMLWVSHWMAWCAATGTSKNMRKHIWSAWRVHWRIGRLSRSLKGPLSLVVIFLFVFPSSYIYIILKKNWNNIFLASHLNKCIHWNSWTAITVPCEIPVLICWNNSFAF